MNGLNIREERIEYLIMNFNANVEAVSVVIATLGSQDLGKTISTLRNGSLPPKEILICIPEREAGNVKNLQSDVVRVVVTACRGQVAQRVEGFKNVKYDFVLQIDDDIIVSDSLVKNLVNVLKSSCEKSVAAPGYFDIKSGNSLHQKPRMGALYKAYLFLINGNLDYIGGSVTNAGLNFGVDTTLINQDILEVGWVPGGCLMHRKENLIVENYFPFKGKAYCEDLIHSYLLKAKGLKLLISREAQCWTQVDSTYQSFSQLLKNKFDELRKRKYFVRLSGGSLARMYVFFWLNLAHSAAKHLNK
jgi:glycosyltransferase involved in cell wall biosynthesis